MITCGGEPYRLSGCVCVQEYPRRRLLRRVRVSAVSRVIKGMTHTSWECGQQHDYSDNAGCKQARGVTAQTQIREDSAERDYFSPLSSLEMGSPSAYVGASRGNEGHQMASTSVK